VYRVLLPAARHGLLAAVLLGVGRAVGETMAVLMATGHAAQIPHGLLDSVRTLTANIAAEMGEAARRVRTTTACCSHRSAAVLHHLRGQSDGGPGGARGSRACTTRTPPRRCS
jgi:ABC-type phosphate transport system permease subunit